MTDPDLSGRRLGEFELEERIGSGGYGTVYRCYQPALQRAAVVKVLRPRLHDAASERFVREAQLASRLDHPFAAHVYSFGIEPDGVRWIAMELVPGITLGEWLRSRGPMSFAQLVPFFEHLAAVVHAAHAHGIVHRDLKPSNIMVIEDLECLFPKLLDLGIAKLRPSPDSDAPLDEVPAPDTVATARIRTTAPLPRLDTITDHAAIQLTPHGIAIGSSHYMSPEQWADPAAVGPTSDIYALGCLAYEALSGRPPFSAADNQGLSNLHLRAEPPPLGEGFPPELDDVLRRALAKLPSERHASALELAADLRAVLRAEPREQLRSSAQQWADRARRPGLLWGRDALADIERVVPAPVLSELECSFVAASRRRARDLIWLRRALVALAAICAVVALLYRLNLAEQQARAATQHIRTQHEVAAARATESALERGRAALLHGEPEAVLHLAHAYRRDPRPTTAFMLARAIQPRLAQQARLAGTHGRMWWATFSPDSSQIATADDRAAQVWDAKTYRLLFTLPHGCRVSQAIYTPNGTKLVTVAESMVRIWDARSGALLLDLKAPPGQMPADFYRASISPDARFVAAIDEGGAMTRVWEVEGGALVAALRTRPGGVARVAFSVDGWLATTGGEEARVFDVHTWKQVHSIPGPIRSLAFDDGSRLATGSATGDISLWTIPSGLRYRQLRSFGESADAIAFSRDGQLVAAGSRDGVMQVWHADSGVLRSQSNPRHSKILWVELDPTATSVLAAHADGTVAVVDVAQGMPLAILDGPQNVVRVARFDAASRVVGASWDGSASVWDASSPYRRWATVPSGDFCNIGMGVHPDRRFIAVGCRNRPTRIWDTSRDQLLAELPSPTLIEANNFVSAPPVVSSAGDLAAIPRGTAVEVYTLPGARLLRTLEHGAAVSAIAFASAGRAMVSGALDGSVRVIREDGSQLALQATGGVSATALLPDGRVIVADAERRVRVYATDGAVLADLELPAHTMSLRWENARLVGIPNCVVNAAPPFVIDLERYRVTAQLVGHVGCVFSARWVSGERILTAGADGTARLWDGSTGRLVQTYPGSSRFLGDAVLMSGMVVGGDADGLLHFWDAESGARLWSIPAHKSAAIGVHIEGLDLVTRGLTGEMARWRLPSSEDVITACDRNVTCKRRQS